MQCRSSFGWVQVVADSDVVFVASGSETLLINGSDLEGMSTAREAVGGVRRFFDISVPRNVATDVSDVPNSRVFNVDDLKEVGQLHPSPACMHITKYRFPRFGMWYYFPSVLSLEQAFCWEPGRQIGPIPTFCFYFIP